MSESEAMFWTLLFKPLILIGLFLFIIYPLKWIAWKLIPEGKIKDRLFKEIPRT